MKARCGLVGVMGTFTLLASALIASGAQAADDGACLAGGRNGALVSGVEAKSDCEGKGDTWVTSSDTGGGKGAKGGGGGHHKGGHKGGAKKVGKKKKKK